MDSIKAILSDDFLLSNFINWDAYYKNIGNNKKITATLYQCLFCGKYSWHCWGNEDSEKTFIRHLFFHLYEDEIEELKSRLDSKLEKS